MAALNLKTKGRHRVSSRAQVFRPGREFWYSAGDTEGSWFAADLAEAVQAAHTLRVYPPGAVMTMMEVGRLGDRSGAPQPGLRYNQPEMSA